MIGKSLEIIRGSVVLLILALITIVGLIDWEYLQSDFYCTREYKTPTEVIVTFLPAAAFGAASLLWVQVLSRLRDQGYVNQLSTRNKILFGLMFVLVIRALPAIIRYLAGTTCA